MRCREIDIARARAAGVSPSGSTTTEGSNGLTADEIAASGTSSSPRTPGQTPVVSSTIRRLAAMDWACRSLSIEWTEGPVDLLRGYQTELADFMHGNLLGSVSTLS